MRFRRFKITTMLVMAAVVGLAIPTVHGQQASSDVAVISIAPLDRLLKDTSYLLRACNVPEMGGLVSIMANQYTQGMDRTKPLGAMVSLEGGAPMAVVFMPMTDRELFFGALAGMGIEPDDLGDGLFEIDTGGQVLYAKDADGWMFVAQTEDALANVPADPAAKLGKLPEKYDVAIRLNAREIPQELKDKALEEIRTGYQRGMAEQRDQTEEERQAAEAMGEASIEQFEQMISDTEQLVFGWAVSAQEQRTYFDGGVMFVEGSKLAEQASLAANLTSDFSMFFLPYSSAKFRFSAEILESDRPVAKNNIRNTMSQAENQLDQSDDVPEEAKELLRELLAGLGKVLEQTIDEGKFDGAGSLSVADDTLRILIGGRIADGNALAAEFKKAAAKIPNDPNAPKFEFDYETYNGVALHRVSGPIKIADPAAQRVFGDEILITIGTGDKSYLIALDPSGDALVKSAIDQMSSAEPAKVTPFDAVVQLQDILQYAQSVSPNSILDNAVNTLSEYAGKDKVQISSQVIPRGGLYRLSVEEGVLRSVGAAAKSAGGGGGGF